MRAGCAPSVGRFQPGGLLLDTAGEAGAFVFLRLLVFVGGLCSVDSCKPRVHTDTPTLLALSRRAVSTRCSIPASSCAHIRAPNRTEQEDWNMASKTTESLKLSQDQIQILEENFNKVSKHPDSTTLMLIAAECGLSEDDTQKWFTLRNAQWRKSEGLPAEEGSVLD